MLSLLILSALTFYPGSEFPGATGFVERAGSEISLHYDFSGGGHYVSARMTPEWLRTAREVAFEVFVPAGVSPTLRLVDSSGQTFQYYVMGNDTDIWEDCAIRINGSGKGVSHWGGADDGDFHQPLTRIDFLADNRPGMPGGARGTMRVRNVRIRDRSGVGRKEQRHVGKSLAELTDLAWDMRTRLAAELPALEKSGGGARTRATMAVMDYFRPWIDTDISRGFEARALRETRELVEIGEDALARIERIKSGEECDAPTPRYVTSPIEISRAQILATREWPDGRREKGNVILSGFGHFGMVRDDLEKLPALGCNVIQLEIGPSWLFPTEDTVNRDAIDMIVATLDRAEKANVQLCLLISPHYWPKWMDEKCPEAKSCGDGFIGYCLYNEQSKVLIERYLQLLIPAVRNKKALHSICLTNESTDGLHRGCKVMAKGWRNWLARRYEDVDGLNRKWKTEHASFDAVPMPEKLGADATSVADLEFIRYKRRAFSLFHRWMADRIRSMAPEIKVHAKIMIFQMFKDGPTFDSVDPAQFGALSDYNGNDCNVWPLGNDPRGWASEWWEMEAGYDYQRSVADIPVINTENHVIGDREESSIPGEHLYSALWQQTVHGQAVNTQWAWQRSYDDGKEDFNGLILERPVCLDAWSRASLDLNRLADLLAPIQNLEPEILVFFPLASMSLGGTRGKSFLKCYRASNWLGRPLGVLTEDALSAFAETGERSRPLTHAKAIILPDTAYLPDEARAGLLRLSREGVKVIAYRTRPEFNDFGEPRRMEQMVFVPKLSERELAERLGEMAMRWGLSDCPRVRSPHSDKGIYGVESRGYRANGKSYVSVVNHTETPVEVRIDAPGRDLITGSCLNRTFTVFPRVPIFAEY